MANEEQNIDRDLEIQKKEQEREERIKEEEAKEKEREKEKEKKKKEKEKKQKRILQRKKKREAKERKRIKQLINLPFKILLQASVLVCIIAFVIKYFGSSMPLDEALLGTFYIFIVLFLGGGIITTAIFYVISEKKEKELNEQIRLEEEKKLKEEEEKRKEELDMLESVMSEGEDVKSRRIEELKKFRDSQFETPSLPEGDKPVSIDDMETNGAMGLPDEFSEPEPLDESEMFEDMMEAQDIPEMQEEKEGLKEEAIPELPDIEDEFEIPDLPDGDSLNIPDIPAETKDENKM